MKQTDHASETFFSALAQPGIQRLRAYDPGHDLVAFRRRFEGQQLIELGSNENPYGPSAKAKEAVLGVIHDSFRYPDPLGADLKRARSPRSMASTPHRSCSATARTSC